MSGGLLGIPGDWRQWAACGDRGDDLFFPTNWAPDQEREAKAICARCPVRESCRQWALDTGQPYGIWGGLNEEERRVLRRRPRRRVRIA